MRPMLPIAAFLLAAAPAPFVGAAPAGASDRAADAALPGVPQPAPGNASLPGVSRPAPPVAPVPEPEPEALETAPGGWVRMGNVDVRISGSISYQIGFGGRR